MAEEEDFQKIKNALRKNIQERNDIALNDSKERAKQLENTIQTQANSIVGLITKKDHFKVSMTIKSFIQMSNVFVDNCS